MEILDYNVIRNNNFDRTKSYFSCYYSSIVLFTDYDAKSYNFAIRYNDNTRNNELYVILYKDKVINDSIPITRDANTGFKLFLIKEVINLLDIRLRNKFVMSKNDFNVNVKFVEERDDNCIIYHIDID
nr:MAG: hypothetical protein [Bacteriophage sp.]